LQVAEAILQAFRMDRMLLIPAAIPPHKRKQTITSPFHRLSMLALATADHPQIFVSSIELEAPDRPYTIETLGRLQQERPAARLFFVMGADSFRDVTMWREHERLLTEYDCIVATRPGVSQTEAAAAHLARKLQANIVDLRSQRIPTEEMLATPRIYLTDYVAMEISSTGLREAAARGEGFRDQVPASVAGYIEKYRLYRSE